MDSEKKEECYNVIKINIDDTRIKEINHYVKYKIILEIFDDREFSVSKVALEISNYQKGLKNNQGS